MKENRARNLDFARSVREGRHPKRRLDSGETTFVFPTWADFMAVRAMFPGLASLNGKERFEAWKQFRDSPLSEPYRVVRSRRQVQQSDKRIQVR